MQECITAPMRTRDLCVPAFVHSCINAFEHVSTSVSRGEVLESCELADERELHHAGRAIALLADDELGHALRVDRWRILVGVLLLTVNEDDDVRILLEGSRLAQIR